MTEVIAIASEPQTAALAVHRSRKRIAPFALHRPDTIGQAAEIADSGGDRIRVMAGACLAKLEPGLTTVDPLPGKRVIRDLVTDTVPPRERVGGREG